MLNTYEPTNGSSLLSASVRCFFHKRDAWSLFLRWVHLSVYSLSSHRPHNAHFGCACSNFPFCLLLSAAAAVIRQTSTTDSFGARSFISIICGSCCEFSRVWCSTLLFYFFSRLSLIHATQHIYDENFRRPISITMPCICIPARLSTTTVLQRQIRLLRSQIL